MTARTARRAAAALSREPGGLLTCTASASMSTPSSISALPSTPNLTSLPVASLRTEPAVARRAASTLACRRYMVLCVAQMNGAVFVRRVEHNNQHAVLRRAVVNALRGATQTAARGTADLRAGCWLTSRRQACIYMQNAAVLLYLHHIDTSIINAMAIEREVP